MSVSDRRYISVLDMYFITDIPELYINSGWSSIIKVLSLRVHSDNRLSSCGSMRRRGECAERISAHTQISVQWVLRLWIWNWRDPRHWKQVNTQHRFTVRRFAVSNSALFCKILPARVSPKQTLELFWGGEGKYSASFNTYQTWVFPNRQALSLE